MGRSWICSDRGCILQNTNFLSCNAWPGPVELIKNNFNGITFKNNDMESF